MALRRRIAHSLVWLSLLSLMVVQVSAQEPCPGNAMANPGMEGGARSTADLGTRGSSVVANGWVPWAVWGYSSYSQEAEFDVEDISLLGRYSTYRVHGGTHSQKFSTMYGVHNAGVYQRIAVPKGSRVNFSAWVQIYTGERSIVTDSNKELISDLESPGNYRAYVGIDTQGEVPPGFGSGPAEGTVWSEAVLDRETRRQDGTGLPYDGWVQLSVDAVAEADHITVYLRGQPEFPVHFNVSYWDDACLTYQAPAPLPTATPDVTNTPVPTAEPTATASPTPTLAPTSTETLVPTVPLEPTQTELPSPTQTASASATSTQRPPEPTPAISPTAAPPAAPSREADDNTALLAVFGLLWMGTAAYIARSLWHKYQGNRLGSGPEGI